MLKNKLILITVLFVLPIKTVLVCVVCCVEINLLVCLVLRHMRLLKCVVAPDFVPCSFWIFVYYVYFRLSLRCCSIEVFDDLTS